jgi:heme A synthase
LLRCRSGLAAGRIHVAFALLLLVLVVLQGLLGMLTVTWLLST